MSRLTVRYNYRLRPGRQAEGAQNPQEQLMRTFRRKRAKGARAKTIKKRHSRPTLNYSTNGFSIKNGRLCLAKCLPIPVVWSRELPSVPTSVRVFQDSLGHWYASFVVEVEQNTLPQSKSSVGIDWGVKAIANSTMARKAADGAIGGAKQELISIAQRAGRSVVIVAPAYTTMTCRVVSREPSNDSHCRNELSCAWNAGMSQTETETPPRRSWPRVNPTWLVLRM